MPPRQRNARRVAHRATATNHFPRHFRRQHIHRPAENRDRHQRIAAHRVDVADRIGRGDAAEVERVIDNRHEKIGGRHHTTLGIDRIHRRVITRGVADPEFRIEVLCAAAGEDHFQHLWGNLAATTGAMAVLGQTNRLAHGRVSGNEWGGF